MSGRINQPNRIDTWLLQDDEKPLTITEDPKLPNAATVILRCQDHTMGGMIRAQLLLDPTVLFAGYKVPHPLENNILLKIQTDDRSNPADALKRACLSLIAQTESIKQQFMDQAKNIEMGMGPDAGGLGGVGGAVGGGMGMGGGVGAGAVGGYDPYGDGFGTAGTGAAGPAGAAEYDF